MHVTPYDCLHKILSYYNMAKTLKNHIKGGAKKRGSHVPDPSKAKIPRPASKKGKSKASTNTVGKARSKGPSKTVSAKASKKTGQLLPAPKGAKPDTGSFTFTIPALNDLTGNLPNVQATIMDSVKTFLAHDTHMIPVGISKPILDLASEVSVHIMDHFLSMGIITEQDDPVHRKGAALARGVGVTAYRRNKELFDKNDIVQHVFRKLTGKHFSPIHIGAVAGETDLFAFDKPKGELAHQDPATLVQGELSTGGEMKNALFCTAVNHPILKIAAEIQKKDAGSWMARIYNEGNDHVWTRKEPPIRKLNAVRLIAQATVLRNKICSDPKCLQFLQEELVRRSGGGGGETMLEYISKDCMQAAVNSISFLQGFSARNSELNPHGAHTGTLFTAARSAAAAARGAAGVAGFMPPSNVAKHLQKREEFMKFLGADEDEPDDEELEEIQVALNETDQEDETITDRVEGRIQTLFMASPTFSEVRVWNPRLNFEENYEEKLPLIHEELQKYFDGVESKKRIFKPTAQTKKAYNLISSKGAKSLADEMTVLESLLFAQEYMLPPTHPLYKKQTYILELKILNKDFMESEPATKTKSDAKYRVIESLTQLRKMGIYVHGIHNLGEIFKYVSERTTQNPKVLDAIKTKQLYFEENRQGPQGEKPNNALRQLMQKEKLDIFSYATKLPVDGLTEDDIPENRKPSAEKESRRLLMAAVHPTQEQMGELRNAFRGVDELSASNNENVGNNPTNVSRKKAKTAKSAARRLAKATRHALSEKNAMIEELKAALKEAQASKRPRPSS